MTRRTLSSSDRGNLYQQARELLKPQPGSEWFVRPTEAEGGCGVTGFACTVPVGGKHIYEPSIQMRNRGNGKGGGIAACGLVPEDLGVSREVLEDCYMLQIALLEPTARGEVEKEFVQPYFDIRQGGTIPHVDDFHDVPLLEVRPPDVVRYFVRVKPDVLETFAKERSLTALTPGEIEDEFVFQNSKRLNDKFYASLGTKKAFVLSHARNLLILKVVGFAEAVVQYYKLADTRAHVWIAHQRYPTRGRVWHPGGCHPFIGMHEALVHNGDFANYHSVCEFLAQRNLFPQFLTDTEASVMLFDLLARGYKYPEEYIIESLAPTTELDFDRLDPKKQKIYRDIQTVHTHSSPDGPWFFIIARSLPGNNFQLLGITDTAMLRPQVFALQEGDVSIGLICSEKQAIDATLASLATEDPRFATIADRYWNARGGSCSDGGAFFLTVSPDSNGGHDLSVTNKFGDAVRTEPGQVHCDLSKPVAVSTLPAEDTAAIAALVMSADPAAFCDYVRSNAVNMDFNRFRRFVAETAERTAADAPLLGIEALTLCLDRRYPTGNKKRSSILMILRAGLETVFSKQPLIDDARDSVCKRITVDTAGKLRGPAGMEKTLLINARGFEAEGRKCDAYLAVDAYTAGWRHIIHYNSRGTRFHGAGFGPDTMGLRVDCYDNPGDYLASGMDGLEVHVHGNAQDQLCQIAKSGKLVVHGDVGQTFLYGAKGGSIYVLGNAAGRPMINAVGRPRVVINGTALDFLAESFMAGDPLNGGGFAIVNGLRVEDDGRIVPLDMPYPGSNLLSLASGGAVYVRDPNHTLVDQQLNGGKYRRLTDADWKLIVPYLEENEKLFDIQIERDLLSVNDELRTPRDVYTKVMPRGKHDHDEEPETE